MNYEVTANYSQDLGFLSFSGLIGGNIMNRVYSSNISQNIICCLHAAYPLT